MKLPLPPQCSRLLLTHHKKTWCKNNRLKRNLLRTKTPREKLSPKTNHQTPPIKPKISSMSQSLPSDVTLYPHIPSFVCPSKWVTYNCFWNFSIIWRIPSAIPPLEQTRSKNYLMLKSTEICCNRPVTFGKKTIEVEKKFYVHSDYRIKTMETIFKQPTLREGSSPRGGECGICSKHCLFFLNKHCVGKRTSSRANISVFWNEHGTCNNIESPKQHFCKVRSTLKSNVDANFLEDC